MMSSTPASCSSSMTVSTAKQLLRNKMRQLLTEMSPEDKRFQSNIITEKVLKNEKVVTSSRVSVYLSTQNEVSTIDLLRQLMNQGKQVFIPKYDPNSRDMKMVSLKSMEEYESLPMTSWNIKQHPLDWHQTDALDQGGLDLIITPGLGFTESGQRLGSGRGYYDRYFQKIRQTGIKGKTEKRKDQRHHLDHQETHEPDQQHESNQMKCEEDNCSNQDDGTLIRGKHNSTHFIGLAFKQQLLPFIPTNDQDIAVDDVIHAGLDRC